MTKRPKILPTLPLGESGLTVSRLAWGMWRFKGDDVAAARACVEAALEAGITFFDTADIYGPDNGEAFGAAEALLGRVLAEAPHLRERFVLAENPDDTTHVKEAAAFYDEFKRWAKNIGAEILIVEEFSNVPHDLIKEKLGRIFTREQQFARV